MIGSERCCRAAGGAQAGSKVSLALCALPRRRLRGLAAQKLLQRRKALLAIPHCPLCRVRALALARAPARALARASGGLVVRREALIISSTVPCETSFSTVIARRAPRLCARAITCSSWLLSQIGSSR